MSKTDWVRTVMVILFAITTIAGLAGWIFFDKDPAMLIPIFAQVTGGAFIGEASAVGKRATFKKEAV